MSNMSRRNFVKMAGAAIAGVSLTGLSGFVSGCGAKAADSKSSAASTTNANKASVQASDKAKVYFTKHIDVEHLQKLYEKVNSEISGKIAIKLHTGEPHGPNILPRDMVQAFQSQIPNSTIIEANVAYGGPRSTTQQHRETLQTNGWTFCPYHFPKCDEAYVCGL